MGVILTSEITCPKCGQKKEETMLTDACQFFYECEQCKTVLRPNEGDCCVYCSYGTMPCPSIQEKEYKSCCSEDNKSYVDNIIIAESCNISDKDNSCCSSMIKENDKNLKEHWDKAYINNPEEKLGWYETNLTPTLELISKSGLNKSSRILNVGSGTTTLIDELLNIGYTKLICSDISEVALNKLESRLKTDKVEFIVDDLTSPTILNNIEPIDLWIDRAVLHFLTEKSDQDTYFDLLNSKVKCNGFVLIAEYNLSGATKCAGLPVQRYNKEMLVNKIGADFELIHSIDYTYIMPSGAERPYIYTLFRKNN